MGPQKSVPVPVYIEIDRRFVWFVKNALNRPILPSGDSVGHPQQFVTVPSRLGYLTNAAALPVCAGFIWTRLARSTV